MRLLSEPARTALTHTHGRGSILSAATPATSVRPSSTARPHALNLDEAEHDHLFRLARATSTARQRAGGLRGSGSAPP
jgi:hypothetical protein